MKDQRAWGVTVRQASIRWRRFDHGSEVRAEPRVSCRYHWTVVSSIATSTLIKLVLEMVNSSSIATMAGLESAVDSAVSKFRTVSGLSELLDQPVCDITHREIKGAKLLCGSPDSSPQHIVVVPTDRQPCDRLKPREIS